ncbi:cobaltochelatase subunit CobN [Bacterioplanoides sp.]|uniref:cobaltochelatase subunit CobN n=1 Tax=Bacterioplanoides sp. TaxID=2066072 RepID=UPI003B5BD24B
MLTPIQLLLSKQMLLLKQVAVLLLLISTVLFSSTRLVQANTADNSAIKSQDYLLVLTSQRNAETVAEAARLFKLQYPQLSVQARTDGQIYETDNKQRAQLILNARAIIGAGLFGPAVAELSSLFKQFKKQQKPLLIFSSDHRLVGVSELAGKNFFSNQQQVRELGKQRATDNFETWLNDIKQQNPAQANWLQARAYWQAGGAENSKELFSWVFQQTGAETLANAAAPQPRLRWFANGKIQNQLPALTAEPASEKKPLVAILDHAGGGRPADAALLRKLCAQIEEQGQQCIASLAYWGEAGVKAVEQLLPYKDQLSVIVMLQDFVIGGGEGRERTNELLQQLNVPLLKAIKLRDRSALEHQLSADGLAAEKVYYQVAMPELQGASQPLIIASAGEQKNDQISGIRIQAIEPKQDGLDALTSRLSRWATLQQKANADKRIAIVYYNHPPGRHNIGADNLDVPASLWQILNQLKAQGYNVGELPASQEALLDQMQLRGVNLPRDANALKNMSDQIQTMAPVDYQSWFNQLPDSVRNEMINGPFGLLHEQLKAAVVAKKPELADGLLHHTFEEMHHLLEGVDHKGRERALALIEQLEVCYVRTVETAEQINNGQYPACLDKEAPQLITALQKTGIEGLGGWGPAPGKVMTFNNQLLLPGLQFGNVFIGPQPPRGWEINEELLHANLAFPPPHQYLAFYHFLRNKFKADAYVHLGRHSTYEFLPRRSVGLGEDDYSRIIGSDIPGVYPYIVDGVGEGIQAKRRGLAVMVDHLTPPLESTPLYDELLQLRQLIESFEASHGSGNEAVAERLVQQIVEKVDQLELRDELAQAMSAELAVMGISFEEVDDDMLVHEVGHYLTDLQERFMPLGLHIFGKNWNDNAVEMMLQSMLGRHSDKNGKPLTAEQKEKQSGWKDLLKQSPDAEMAALINGLNGRYVAPGQGNDPIRSPDSLPTGRNFYALDSSLIPSKLAWQLGKEMAADARKNNPQTADKNEAIILWASDVVRDEGVMIAFGLDMLGLEPVWNSRGLVKGLKRQTLPEGRSRRDMVFTSSGLFRDLYGQQMSLLNRATLMALDASSDTIRKDYPALTLALSEALSLLGKDAKGGSESLEFNQVAKHWVNQARVLLRDGVAEKKAGIIASMRVFGDAPGSYGAGINRMVERSGAWENRSELADVYIRRIGHSYGLKDFGAPAQKAFKTLLKDVENTYFGRSSNLYGLIDNNDAFDYLGGLSLAVESVSGKAPNNFVLDHSDPQNFKARPLGLALRQELRGRFLNPEWLKGLMEHGYAGARTMGNEFLEYLWGWQVTNPTLVGDWAWEEVKAVYIDDKHQLKLDEFLQQGHNVHVKANMLAIMLVAIHKDFWNADQQTVQQLASEFAELVAKNGLPGSGHTDPDNPMLGWLEQHLSSEQWQALKQQIDLARPVDEDAGQETEYTRIAELEVTAEELAAAQQQAEEPQNQQPTEQATQQKQDEQQNDAEASQQQAWIQFALVVFAIFVVLIGFVRSRRL